MVRISCLKMARKFCTGFFYTNDSCLSWWILEKFPWTSLGRTSFVLCTITIGKWGCTGDLIKMQLDMPICFPKCWVYLCLDTFFMSSWVNVVMFWLRRLHALKPLWFPIKSFFFVPKSPWTQNCGSPTRATKTRVPPGLPFERPIQNPHVPLEQRKKKMNASQVPFWCWRDKTLEFLGSKLYECEKSMTLIGWYDMFWSCLRWHVSPIYCIYISIYT